MTVPKRLFFILALLLAPFLSMSDANAQVRVRGYFRRDGTYVQPHVRSSPNSSPYDNYSYPGNINPYTGKVATGDPLTYLERYYRTRSYVPSAPRRAAVADRQSAAPWSAPSIAALPQIGEALSDEELNRSKRYCDWLYDASSRNAGDCFASQRATLGALVLVDYRSTGNAELERGARFCEWLYDDNRAAFYDCLNSQIFGLSKTPADFTGVASNEESRAKTFCEWLYGDNRASYADCARLQASQLKKVVAEPSNVPAAEWSRATKFCEWLYGDNRGSVSSCKELQSSSLRRYQASGLMAAAITPADTKYCEWLYGNNRASFWSCIDLKRRR